MVRHAGGSRPRILWSVALLVLVLGTAAFLRLGTVFYEEDPLQPVDAVFPLAGSEFDRQLEAADLFKAGYGRAIVLTVGNRERSVEELKSRGINVPSSADFARDIFTQLGIPASAIIVPPIIHDNTAHEAHTLVQLAREHGWHRVMVVTSKFHTRRAGFAFRRALKGSGVEVVVRSTRYDPANPARWWASRADLRWVLSEGPKFAAYVLGLRE